MARLKRKSTISDAFWPEEYWNFALNDFSEARKSFAINLFTRDAKRFWKEYESELLQEWFVRGMWGTRPLSWYLAYGDRPFIGLEDNRRRQSQYEFLCERNLLRKEEADRVDAGLDLHPDSMIEEPAFKAT